MWQSITASALLECELGQGYLFSKPLLAADIEACFLNRRDSPLMLLAEGLHRFAGNSVGKKV